jgi:hypothetical protein
VQLTQQISQLIDVLDRVLLVQLASVEIEASAFIRGEAYAEVEAALLQALQGLVIGYFS